MLTPKQEYKLYTQTQKKKLYYFWPARVLIVNDKTNEKKDA